MVPYDHSVCLSKLVDFGIIAVGSLLLAKYSRKFLFKQEIITVENFMNDRNMDVKFWKALIAYGISFGLGYLEMKNSLRENYLADLAIEYSPNYTADGELGMKEIEPVLGKFYKTRFPWLAGGNGQN